MKKADVLAYFDGSIQQVADLVEIAHTSVIGWGDVIPERCAARLEKETNGALVYDHEIYKALGKVKRQHRQAA